jgi:hypothetical protein
MLLAKSHAVLSAFKGFEGNSALSMKTMTLPCRACIISQLAISSAVQVVTAMESQNLQKEVAMRIHSSVLQDLQVKPLASQNLERGSLRVSLSTQL